jgi:hypothetical protein
MGGSLSSAIGQEASKQSSPYIRPIHSVRDLCAASPNTRLTTNNYSPGEGMKVIKEAFGVPSPSSTSSLTSLQNSALKSRSAWRSTQGLSNGRTNQTHTLSRPENPRTSCRGMISLGAPARHLRCFMSIRCPGTKARNYTVNSPRHSRLQPYNKPRALASASSSSFYATSNSASSSDSFDNISG